MINLRDAIIKKEFRLNESKKKVVNIVEKILYFNKQQKGKGLLYNLARAARVAKVCK